jgi:hypothetical protein
MKSNRAIDGGAATVDVLGNPSPSALFDSESPAMPFMRLAYSKAQQQWKTIKELGCAHSSA